MEGVDLTTMSILLGHKDLTMIVHYFHLSLEHMSNALDILEGVQN